MNRTKLQLKKFRDLVIFFLSNVCHKKKAPRCGVVVVLIIEGRIDMYSASLQSSTSAPEGGISTLTHHIPRFQRWLIGTKHIQKSQVSCSNKHIQNLRNTSRNHKTFVDTHSEISGGGLG